MAQDISEPSDDSRTRHIDVMLGRRVRRLREDHGLTQVQVCEMLGISSNQWSRHEAGKNRIPAARLWQFCHLVKADVKVVFGDLPHSVGPLTALPGMAEEGSSFGHRMEVDEADTRAIAAAARQLSPQSRRLLLAIIRVMSEDAKTTS
jgi:transcriptional regulator with XRE-family HTH domain